MYVLVLIKGTFHEFTPKPFPSPVLFCWYFHIPLLTTGQDLRGQRREPQFASVARSLPAALSGLHGSFQRHCFAVYF